MKPDNDTPSTATRRIAGSIHVLGALVVVATFAIADWRAGGALLFLVAIAAFAFAPYALLSVAARTGHAGVALVVAVVMFGVDIGARVRVRFFPQDAQDGLLLVFLPVYFLLAAVAVLAVLALLAARRRRRS
jgi:hypothetical protein